MIGLGHCPSERPDGWLVAALRSQHAVCLIEYRDAIPDLEQFVLPLPSDPRVRAILSAEAWLRIWPDFLSAVGMRVVAAGLGIPCPVGAIFPTCPALGKELCLLCWAIEEIEPEKIPAALHWWRELDPTERWWLYMTTAAATGQALQRNIGWRKALRFMFLREAA